MTIQEALQMKIGESKCIREDWESTYWVRVPGGFVYEEVSDRDHPNRAANCFIPISEVLKDREREKAEAAPRP